MNFTSRQDVDEIDSRKNGSSILIEEGGPSKKGKLSVGGNLLAGVQLKVLEYENQKLKELVHELENEKLQQNDESNTKIKKMEFNIADLTTKIVECEAKHKTLENKNQGYETQIKKLNDQNMSKKNIKAEIKDSVEEEREFAQTAKENFINEIRELKIKVNDLEQLNQQLFDSQQIEIKNLKQRKADVETEVQKLKESVQAVEKIKLYTVQKMGEEIDNLKKKCYCLQESNQNSLNRYEMEIKNLKSEKQAVEKIKLNNELKMKAEIDDLKKKLANNTTKIVPKQVESSEKLSDDSDYERIVKKLVPAPTASSGESSDDEPPVKKPTPEKNRSKVVQKLLESSESSDDSVYEPVVQILYITKLEGTNEGWLLHSVDNESGKPRSLSHEAMNKATFKLNISGQLLVQDCKSNIRVIIDRINSCDLKMLHLVDQTISFDDYSVLVSSKKIEFCVLENVLITGVKGGIINKVLSSLPSIKVFKCKFYLEDQSVVAKNLSQLPSFRDLQKFKLSNLSPRFKLKDIEAFLQKNNIDASYIFSFCPLSPATQNKIKKAQNKLLKSLPFHRNISVVSE